MEESPQSPHRTPSSYRHSYWSMSLEKRGGLGRGSDQTESGVDSRPGIGNEEKRVKWWWKTKDISTMSTERPHRRERKTPNTRGRSRASSLWGSRAECQNLHSTGRPVIHRHKRLYLAVAEASPWTKRNEPRVRSLQTLAAPSRGAAV